MKELVNEIWWMVLLRSVALLLFGITTLVWPGVTFVSLAVFFTAYILVSGIADIVVAFREMAHRQTWFVTLLLGALEVVLGLYLLANPTLALTTFIKVVGFTFVFQGVFTLIASIVDTKDAGVKFLEVISGVLGILVGFLVLQNPVSGGLALTWTLGVYGVIAGTLGIAWALSLRHMSGKVEKVLTPHKAMA